MSVVTATTNGTDLTFSWTPPAGSTTGMITITYGSTVWPTEPISGSTLTMNSVPLGSWSATVTYGSTIIPAGNTAAVNGVCATPIALNANITYTADGFIAYVHANVLSTTEPNVIINQDLRQITKTGLKCGDRGTISFVDAMAPSCTYTLTYSMPDCTVPLETKSVPIVDFHMDRLTCNSYEFSWAYPIEPYATIKLEIIDLVTHKTLYSNANWKSSIKYYSGSAAPGSYIGVRISPTLQNNFSYDFLIPECDDACVLVAAETNVYFQRRRSWLIIFLFLLLLWVVWKL